MYVFLFKVCCCCLVAKSSLMLFNPVECSMLGSLSFIASQSWLKFMSTELVMPSNHLILFHLLLLPSVFLSIRVFSVESDLPIRWPNYWSFSFSTSPSKEYLGLFSFKIDLLDLLAVQGTLESSPAPQFKGISSLALSLLYGPTLTSIRDY